MTRKRAHIPAKEVLAAALRDMAVEENGVLVRAIPYEVAKQMTADQIISLFHRDHGIPHALGGPDEHWNITMRFIPSHRVKSATVDTPQIAKADRIADAHREFQRKMLEKSGVETGQETGQKRHKFRWGKRPFPSRPFPKKQGVT